MIRVLFLLLCLTCYAIGGTYDFKPYTKKRHSASEFIYPYFELSIGVEHSSSEVKTESYTHWYHDNERDEMIYDEDLYYDIFTNEGVGPMLETKIGALLFQRGVLFLHLGLMRFKGTSHYKYYSLDKEEFKERGHTLQIHWGFGTKVYPLVKLVPILDGLFIGVSLAFIHDDYNWDDYGMSYQHDETGFKVEAGHLWNISQHYFVGVTVHAANYAINIDTSHEYTYDTFEMNKPPEREPIDDSNTVQFGIAITVVRK